MENKYFRILSAGVEKNLPSKYFFYNFYGELLSPMDYFEFYFDEQENFLDTITLMKLRQELGYYLISMQDEEVGYLFYYYFTKDSSTAVKKSTLEDEIEEYYNSLNKFYGQKRYDFRNFPSGYQRWESVFRNDIREDSIRLEQQKRFNEKLMIESNSLFLKKKNTYLKKRKDEKYLSELQVVDVSSEFLVTENDGSSLFNRCKTSENIPFVWWKDEQGKDYYKVYSPINEEKIPRFDLFETPIKPENNTIYFFIFKRNISITKKFLRVAGGNYLLCSLSLKRSTLLCNHPKYIESESGIDYILRYVRDSFKIKKTPNTIIFHQKITTKVYFPPQNIDSSIIFYLIQTFPSLSHFFYSETRRSYAEDPTMVVSYRGFKRFLYSDEYSSSTYTSSSVNFSIGNNVFIDGETLLECTITKAHGDMELECFIDELTALLGLYSANFLRIKEYISGFVEEISREILEEEGEEITTNVLYYKKLSQIVSKTGDMYSGASKKVQCLKQPIVISPNQVDDWRNLKTKEGELRTILTFPPEKGRDKLSTQEKNLPENTSHLWVCPDDEYPHPRLFSNTEKLYPYLPICQTNPMDKKEKEILSSYYLIRDKGVNGEEGISQNENLIKTDKIRKYGEVAELSLELSAVLKNLFDNEFQNFTRMGTDVGPNSFIAAVLMCCKEYRNIDDKRKREKVLKYFRNELKNYISSMKQEFYLESEEDVRLLLDDHSTNIDSYLFYRGLEEMLSVNIYVFKYFPSLKEINFEIPRNALYHIRNYNPERRTILIFKHFGNEADALSFPHYEYILTLPSELDDEIITDTTKKPNVFEFSFGGRIYSSFVASQQFYAFAKENSIVSSGISSPEKSNSPSILEEKEGGLNSECRVNSYNKIDWVEILRSKKILSQYIDGFGKCRIINIELSTENDSPSVKKKRGKGEKVIVSLFIPPSPPLNVKTEEKVYTLPRELTTSVLSSFEERPSSIVKEGIFFRILDFESGIFIPYEKERIDTNFSNYILVKRSANILRECIEWCWRCDSLQLPADEWIEKYLHPSVEQKEDHPNFDKVTIAFPILENVSTPAAIDSLRGWWGSVFDSVKNKISLGVSVYYSMKKYLLEKFIATQGMENKPERYLQSEIKNSFSIREENIVLFGKENYSNYVSSVTKKNVNYISSIVDFSLPFPQIIKINTGIYIVQSVVDDSIDNAILVCSKWKEENKNLAESIDERIDTSKYNYGILIQTSDGRIIPQQDFTNGKKDYLQILFNQGKYMSMLKIL